MNFNFGEILTRAWQITWKYKVLWIFGILAGCTNGGGGGGGGGGGNTGFSTGPSDYDVPPELRRFFYQMGDFVSWVEDNLWLFIAMMVLVFLVLFVISIFLGTIGRIGLIKGSFEAEQGAQSLAFGALFSTSMPYFWRVFGLSFLVGLALFIIVVPIVLVSVLSVVGIACLIPIICLLIPVGFVVGIVIEQANRAIVLEDLSMFDGLKRGWEIARANIGPMIIMALILFGITLVAGIIIAIPIFIVVFPTIFAFAMGEGQSFTPIYVALACICLYVPVSLVLNGIVTTFAQSAWTLTYMRLTQKPETPESPVFAETDA
jgi:hypothetical protein